MPSATSRADCRTSATWLRPGLEQLAQQFLDDLVDDVRLVGLDQAPAQVRNTPADRAVEQVLARDDGRVRAAQPTGEVERCPGTAEAAAAPGRDGGDNIHTL